MKLEFRNHPFHGDATTIECDWILFSKTLVAYGRDGQEFMLVQHGDGWQISPDSEERFSILKIVESIPIVIDREIREPVGVPRSRIPTCACTGTLHEYGSPVCKGNVG